MRVLTNVLKRLKENETEHRRLAAHRQSHQPNDKNNQSHSEQQTFEIRDSFNPHDSNQTQNC